MILLKKIISLGIIILLTGVSYSSAISFDNKSTIIKITDKCFCKNKDDNGICDFLVLYDAIISLRYTFIFDNILEYLIENGNQIFVGIIETYLDILNNRHNRIWEYGYYLDCWWIPPWYYPDSI